MGIADGTVQGTTKILDNGPDTSRMNIVLVAEGFTTTQQATFNGLCTNFVTALQAEPWYPLFGSAINVHRLNVASDDSGVDDPTTCGDGSTGSGTAVDTYFDASFCNDGIRRCLSGDYGLVRTTLTAQLPQWDVGAVLVNTTDHGGCANGDVFWTAVRTGWENIALHELGHAGFGLADEYHYWEGCSSGETDRDNAPVGEPAQPNVTTVTTRAGLKWSHLLTPGVPVPTMLNPDCAHCDDRANVLTDDDAIGLYEGAKYYHCGRFRPAYRCRMRDNTQGFCRVCVEAIAIKTNEYVPATPMLEVVPLTLDFGDVAHGLTLYLPFEVRNVRNGRPGPLRVTLTPPTGEFTYAPGTELSFTLPTPVDTAHTSRLVFVSYTSSSLGSPTPTGQAVVSTLDDPAHPSVGVALSARPVPPPPVDSVLVIDRSGSMSDPTGVPGQTKIDHAIEAANLYVSLLKDGDQIGVVRYNQVSGPGDVLLTLRPAGPSPSGAGRLAARGVLNTTNLHPDGYTSIGGGIINGSGVLDAASATARALVVLTDGIQNRAPDIPAASAVVSPKTPKQRVFSVGLGLNQLEDKLDQIASVTNGTAQITGELVDQREFLLQKLYVQILSDVADDAFVRDPKRIANPGDRQATTVHLGEVDVACDFIVVFRRTYLFPKYMLVELEAPDGTRYGPADVATMPNAEFVQGDGHAFYRVQFPVKPEAPDAHVGQWKVWVENLSRGEHFFAGILTYSVMAKARSDLRLGGRVVQPSKLPGTPMEIVLEPTLYGRPVSLDPPVRLDIVRPDGVTKVLTAGPDAHGAYRATFGDTGLVGSYLISTEVSATTPAGHHVTRFRQMTGLIFVPGQTDDGGWGDDDRERDCKEAQRALDVLARLVERCCAPHADRPDPALLRLIAKHDLLAELERRLDDPPGDRGGV
ncbi:M64 family metallopeptidase [Gordonia rhizosphera]|uniref:VWFA domain-containing protein n=1 Tax=Gordonia rhizosphera NBRC 16068 TaxID=1108045 RepID=K6V3U5_9ACTN|nr:M64 family metallopeptidase [Gordonia rhizosphera]GAB90773.1 hypothetical protein GORHZ_117_00370 [Gordonia rhizosphera NBRC 16068]